MIICISSQNSSYYRSLYQRRLTTPCLQLCNDHTDKGLILLLSPLSGKQWVQKLFLSFWYIYTVTLKQFIKALSIQPPTFCAMSFNSYLSIESDLWQPNLQQNINKANHRTVVHFPHYYAIKNQVERLILFQKKMHCEMYYTIIQLNNTNWGM